MNASPLNDEVLQDVSGGTQIPYIVAPGDTLEEIAKKFHCTVEQICRWNLPSEQYQKDSRCSTTTNS